MEYLALRNGNRLAIEIHRNCPESNNLVVLVHGTCGNRNNFFFPALAELGSINVLNFDLEGNGDSEGEFLIGGFMREVENIHEVVLFAQSLGFNVVSLIGHSKGGNSVLIYSSVYSDVPLIIAIAARYNMSILPRFLDPLIPEVEDKGFSFYTLKDKTFRIDKSGIQERRDLNMNRVLETVQSKVVVLCGDRDDITDESDAHRIAEVLGDRCLKKVVLQGANHFFMKNLDLLVDCVSSAIKEFLDTPKI